MAAALNAELIRRGQLDGEPDAEDGREARIEAFLDRLCDGAGLITFADGSRLDGAAALAASPLARDAIRTAILVAQSGP